MYLKKVWFLLWYRLFLFSFQRAQSVLGGGEFGTCANRVWTTLDIGNKLEITVVWRDKRQEDGYSRTELLKMLREVRKHEAIQNWKVPE